MSVTVSVRVSVESPLEPPEIDPTSQNSVLSIEKEEVGLYRGTRSYTWERYFRLYSIIVHSFWGLVTRGVLASRNT